MSLKPKRARVTTGASAWWYDERGGISVFIENTAGVLSCVIKRSALIRFIERSNKDRLKP